MNEEQLERLRRALIEEGFESPHGPARVDDYVHSMPGDDDPNRPAELAALQAADRETNRLNDEALRRAVEAALRPGE